MKLEGMDAARVAAYPSQQHERVVGQTADSTAVTIEKTDAGIAGDVSRKTHQNPTPVERPVHQDDSTSERVVKEAIDKANKILMGSNRKFEISIHEKTKDVLVKVVDADTNETIKEIPPKKLVDVMVSLCEMAGILFDKKG